MGMLQQNFIYKMLTKRKFKNPVNSFVAKVKVALRTKFQEFVTKYVVEISLKVKSPTYNSKPYVTRSDKTSLIARQNLT